MGNKNKKNRETTGIQPKGGAYADAKLAAQGGVNAVDPMVANAALKQKAKEDKIKDKEKAKKDKEEKKKNKRTMAMRIKDTALELKKVRWPSFKTALKQTGVVLAVVVIFGIVLFGIDMGLGELYKLLTKGF
jgi:preprotein translocase subunit SecE